MNYEEAVSWQNEKGITVYDNDIAAITSIDEAVFLRRIVYLWDKFKEEYPDGIYIVPIDFTFPVGMTTSMFNTIARQWVELGILHTWQGSTGNRRHYVIVETQYALYLTILRDLASGAIIHIKDCGLLYQKNINAEDASNTPVKKKIDTETKPNTPAKKNFEAAKKNFEAAKKNFDTSEEKFLTQCQKISRLYNSIKKYIKINRKKNKKRYKNPPPQKIVTNVPKPLYEKDSVEYSLVEYFLENLTKRCEVSNQELKSHTTKALEKLKQEWCSFMVDIQKNHNCTPETIMDVIDWLGDIDNDWYAQYVDSVKKLKSKFKNCLKYTYKKIPIENEDWCWAMSNAFIQLNDIQNYIYTRADIKKNYEEPIKKMFRFFERKNVLPQEQINLTFECLDQNRPKGGKHEEWILKNTRLWNKWMPEFIR